MGFEHTDAFTVGTLDAGSPPLDGAFDWHGLHARLAAAHAARRSILGLPDASPGRGSFDAAAALALAGQAKPQRDVNQPGLADGKQPRCIAADVADFTLSGDRGQ